MSRWSLVLVLMLGGIAVVGRAAPTNAPAPAIRKPAILFSCPGPNRYEYVGFDYMRALVQAGFEVDYCEESAELTWDRVKAFNVLVVLNFPPREGEGQTTLFAAQPPWREAYFALIERFRQAGGGVFLHYNPGSGGVAPNDLLKPWGLQLPILHIKDPAQAQTLSNMSHPVVAAWTDQVLPGPVSEAVRQIWYPIDPHYMGANTMPLLVDDNWQVVVKASRTAVAQAPVFGPSDWKPSATAVVPAEPVKEPVLFAIRAGPGAGRLAAIQQWHSFSIGSGMKWLYNNEILSRGLGTRGSDYGRLLQNTYRWLAEPSLKAGGLGGHVTDALRLTEPQLRPDAQAQLAEWVYREEEVLEYRRPPRQGQIFRGLIGVETAFSGGTGSVADFARVAREQGLDFVGFVEDFAKLTPQKLEALKADCARYSTTNLLLLPGYKMEVNTGNRMFIVGKNPAWPPEILLVGADRKTFNLQHQDADGQYTRRNPALDWLLSFHGAPLDCSIGYYDFSHSDNGMAMHDLRAYSMAAVRTYENGKLIDDALADYLVTIQSTAVPTPVSLNIVRAPADLAAAVGRRESLTYAQARSLNLLVDDALRWSGSYDGMNVFPSDGPIIRAWPRCLRVFAFGAELFVSGRCLDIAPLHVTSDVGLKELRLYDGQDLFRRFVLDGTNTFHTNLLLSGAVQRNIALVAEDVKGGRAVSFAHRSYKEGSMCPIFCSDHVNDCGWMLLAHGPVWPKFFRAPEVPNAGYTWDGGPKAWKPLCSGEFTRPSLWSSAGSQAIEECNQMPLLEFSDEGATRCRMVSTEKFPPEIPVVGPWSTYGPLIPNPLMDAWASYTEFDQYLIGVDPNAYGAIGWYGGAVASLFSERLTFKQDLTVHRLRLYHSGWRGKTAASSMVLTVGQGARIDDALDLTDLPEQVRRFKIPTGGWYALFSSQMANAHLFINRGGPLVLQANAPGAYWLELWADLKDQPVKAGEGYDFEMFGMTWPLDLPIADARNIAAAVAYLENPAGLDVRQGRRVPSAGGLLELTPDRGAVELVVPKPPDGANRQVPVRVGPFNKRWTVGLQQLDGYRTHYYSKSNSGWRQLGLDFESRAYASLFTGKATNTHVVIGHPVVADEAGKEIFIQVTKVRDESGDHPAVWHVSVNNPLDAPVKTTLRQAFAVPGLSMSEQTVTLAPGEYRVLVETGKP